MVWCGRLLPSIPTLRTLLLNNNRISKLQDIPERKDGVVQVVGSRASELSARRLQRQRAREAHRGSAAMTHQVDREANRFFT